GEGAPEGGAPRALGNLGLGEPGADDARRSPGERREGPADLRALRRPRDRDWSDDPAEDLPGAVRWNRRAGTGSRVLHRGAGVHARLSASAPSASRPPAPSRATRLPDDDSPAPRGAEHC